MLYLIINCSKNLSRYHMEYGLLVGMLKSLHAFRISFCEQLIHRSHRLCHSELKRASNVRLILDPGRYLYSPNWWNLREFYQRLQSEAELKSSQGKTHVRFYWLEWTARNIMLLGIILSDTALRSSKGGSANCNYFVCTFSSNVCYHFVIKSNLWNGSISAAKRKPVGLYFSKKCN